MIWNLNGRCNVVNNRKDGIILPSFYVLDCRETVYLGGKYGTHTGSFSSPGYPHGTYASRKQCTWIVKVPFNYRVLLHFYDFDVESSESCSTPNQNCTCDYVDVSDGELLISKKLAKLCGSTIPPDILTSGRFLRVDLVTDESNNRKGFSANFYSVSPDGVTSSTFERKHLKTIPPDTDEPGKGDYNARVFLFA